MLANIKVPSSDDSVDTSEAKASGERERRWITTSGSFLRLEMLVELELCLPSLLHPSRWQQRLIDVDRSHCDFSFTCQVNASSIQSNQSKGKLLSVRCIRWWSSAHECAVTRPSSLSSRPSVVAYQRNEMTKSWTKNSKALISNASRTVCVCVRLCRCTSTPPAVIGKRSSKLGDGERERERERKGKN